ncbi:MULTISPECIES: ArsR/SmtB family transcription factor [Streptomyces]|uniref:ArsR/SmtB family transcription factor n=1 Tax=Streptomyces TaxID=1883 RepID=UPI00345B92EC
MLRVHFTGLDLARLRLAGDPDALWETVLSLHRLRDKQGESIFGDWRSETRARLNGETRLLAPLVPSRGYFPDFLTPPEGVLGLDSGMQALRETPGERVHRELGRLATARTLPAWIRSMAEGDGRAFAKLTGALQAYHEAAIAPYWQHIQAQIEADRAVRGRALLDGGADALLSSLPPMMRWRAPVLEADYPVDRDVHLNGRGLLLVPSFFCRRTPVTYRDPDLTPVLVYPARHMSESAPAVQTAPRSLGKLVGHTRSAVLGSIGGGCTTSELARRVGVSAASASQHAGVLREAGLVLTLRNGSAVMHTLTPLGAALLRGGHKTTQLAQRAPQSSIPERSTPATMLQSPGG